MRYVGSVGRDRTYSNRGYGLSLRLNHGGLEDRWHVLDPSTPSHLPDALRRQKKLVALDLNGNGVLEPAELTRSYRPMLQLVSRSSTTTRVIVDVEILGGSDRHASLDRLLQDELERLPAVSPEAKDQAYLKRTSRRLAPDFEARLLELRPERRDSTYRRIALIDQGHFMAEDNTPRRQVVKVVLEGKSLEPRFQKDHELFLRGLVLNRRGSSMSMRERW